MTPSTPDRDGNYSIASDLGAIKVGVETLTKSLEGVKTDFNLSIRTLKEDVNQSITALKDDFGDRLKELVTREAFEAERAAVAERFEHISERVKEEVAERKKAEENQRTFRRWLVALSVPSLLTVVGLVVNAFA